MSLNAMFERAKELGVPAIALTDHGILAGFYDFMKLAKKHEIKPIPGIEAYYVPDAEADDEAGKKTRQHLVLMAKDIDGFKAICRAVYRSYSHIVKTSAGSFPRMTEEILKSCFGPESEGYGHVIATSACMNGVLSQLLLEAFNLKKETKTLEDKRDKYHPVDAEFLDALKTEEEMQEAVNDLISKRDALAEEIKSISIVGMKRRLKTLEKEPDEHKKLADEIACAEKRKGEMSDELASVKKQIATAKTKKTAYSKSLSAMKASVERYETINKQIDDILAGARSSEEMYVNTVNAAKNFEAIFGKGNFYIELQYHRVTEETMVMPILAQISKETGIPVVAANDAHYATNSREDVRARTLVAAMRFNEKIDESAVVEGYGEMYLKTDEELKSILSEIIDIETIDQAMENIGVIVDACNVELVHGQHYPIFRGGEPGETPIQRLRRLAGEGIPKRYPGGEWKKEYAERLDYELGIIEKTGYADYLCIVQDFLEYGRELGAKCPEEVGYTIGPGRGSAVGSLTCYLSGITSVDPMRYGLLFERFLNLDRVSQPDIDSDFHTEIRADVIEYVKSKYGEKAVCNIMTKGKMAGRSAVRGVGRVTNIPESIVDTVARMIPTTPNAKIADAPGIDEYCDSNPVARALVEDTRLIEDTIVNYGMHAAGVIISDNDDVGEYVAMMFNDAKDQWVAQCDMGQCEADAGLLKMDFLGLNNLDIITDTLRRIKRNHGVSIDIEKVSLEPEVFSEIFAKGNTNCVFQFESSGMKDMLRKFKPDCMEDIILLVAAYRPGPMQYIPDII
ncbi:MAG: PHP domain-containing protein, partial [Clostridiales bacterium]|nr:PHP domain-containing protein [Clostridiales bacterium]